MDTVGKHEFLLIRKHLILHNMQSRADPCYMIMAALQTCQLQLYMARNRSSLSEHNLAVTAIWIERSNSWLISEVATDLKAQQYGAANLDIDEVDLYVENHALNVVCTELWPGQCPLSQIPILNSEAYSLLKCGRFP